LLFLGDVLVPEEDNTVLVESVFDPTKCCCVDVFTEIDAADFGAECFPRGDDLEVCDGLHAGSSA
jgi:hypothetical protein